MSAGKRDSLEETVQKAEIVILDIEGTTTSISFVKDTLFPYIRENLESYVKKHWNDDEFAQDLVLLREQAVKDEADKVEGVVSIAEGSSEDLQPAVIRNVLWQMDLDRKTKALKQLQGHVMRDGYSSGKLKGHVFDDVVPALRSWIRSNRQLYIYSSGSVEAQKLLFGHTEEGDLLELFAGHFDTEVGAKNEPGSYSNIIKRIGCESGKVVFFTDVPAEARAARSVGVNAVLVSRPGNAPLSEEDRIDFAVIKSFHDVVFETSTKRKRLSAEEESIPVKANEHNEDIEMMDVSSPKVSEESSSSHVENGETVTSANIATAVETSASLPLKVSSENTDNQSSQKEVTTEGAIEEIITIEELKPEESELLESEEKVGHTTLSPVVEEPNDEDSEPAENVEEICNETEEVTNCVSSENKQSEDAVSMLPGSKMDDLSKEVRGMDEVRHKEIESTAQTIKEVESEIDSVSSEVNLKVKAEATKTETKVDAVAEKLEPKLNTAQSEIISNDTHLQPKESAKIEMVKSKVDAAAEEKLKVNSIVEEAKSEDDTGTEAAKSKDDTGTEEVKSKDDTGTEEVKSKDDTGTEEVKSKDDTGTEEVKSKDECSTEVAKSKNYATIEEITSKGGAKTEEVTIKKYIASERMELTAVTVSTEGESKVNTILKEAKAHTVVNQLESKGETVIDQVGSETKTTVNDMEVIMKDEVESKAVAKETESEVCDAETESKMEKDTKSVDKILERKRLENETTKIESKIDTVEETKDNVEKAVSKVDIEMNTSDSQSNIKRDEADAKLPPDSKIDVEVKMESESKTDKVELRDEEMVKERDSKMDVHSTKSGIMTEGKECNADKMAAEVEPTSDEVMEEVESNLVGVTSKEAEVKNDSEGNDEIIIIKKAEMVESKVNEEVKEKTEPNMKEGTENRQESNVEDITKELEGNEQKLESEAANEVELKKAPALGGKEKAVDETAGKVQEVSRIEEKVDQITEDKGIDREEKMEVENVQISKEAKEGPCTKSIEMGVGSSEEKTETKLESQMEVDEVESTNASDMSMETKIDSGKEDNIVRKSEESRMEMCDEIKTDQEEARIKTDEKKTEQVENGIVNGDTECISNGIVKEVSAKKLTSEEPMETTPEPPAVMAVES